MDTILLVEDEEPVLEIVRNLLGLNRYLVIEAHDGLAEYKNNSLVVILPLS